MVKLTLDKPQSTAPGVLEDIGNVASSAARTGLELAVSPLTQSEWIPALSRWVIAHSPFMDEKERAQTLQEFEQSYGETKIGADKENTPGRMEAVEKYVTNPMFGAPEPQQAQTLPGKIAQRTLEIGPSIALSPGTLAQKLLGTAGAGTGGPVGREIAKELGGNEAWQSAADIGGSLFGGGLPATYNRIVQPNPIPPTRQPAVDIMRTRNVPLSVGQQTGNQRLLKKEQMAGGPEAWEQQPAEFSRAATETQGGFPPGTRQLTNATMRAELDRMGAEFDRLSGISQAPFNNQLMNSLTNALDQYRQNPVVGGRVEQAINGLFDHAMNNNGVITGEGYRLFNTKISDIIRNTEDGAERSAFMDIKDVVDDAIQQNLPPNEQHAWRTVRAQYRNYLPIEFAKSAQGQANREGFISPQGLTTGIRNVEGRREVASGDRPMTELAEAGGTTMVKPTTSGTPEGLRAQLAGLIPAALGTLAAGGTALASAAGSMPAAITGGVGGTLALGSWLVPRLRDAFIRSQTGQDIMGRNLAPRMDTNRVDLTALIAAARAAQLQQQQGGQPGFGGPR